MKFRSLAASVLSAALLLFMNAAFGQAPGPASPIAANTGPLYVVSYVEAQPPARDEAIKLLRDYRNASLKAPGNARCIVVRSLHRPGQFVIVSTWNDRGAWDAHQAAAGTKEFRDKLATLRSAPTDDRLNASLSVGLLEDPQAKGAVYVVTHVDVIPQGKDDAVTALSILAQANRHADGNLRFEVVQQANRPNHFTVFEIWRSRAAFDANVTAPAQRLFRDKLGLMTGALYDERLYELLN
jgi:quinol monooxygenase YgiN